MQLHWTVLSALVVRLSQALPAVAEEQTLRFEGVDGINLEM